MEEILKITCMFWIKGRQDKDKFLEAFRKHLPVDDMHIVKEREKIVPEGDLVLYSMLSDNEFAELEFPDQIGEHYKLYCVHYKGCTTVLYGLADECK